jgi:hypothetical protein
MDFFNHREGGGMVFYHVFLLSALQCTGTKTVDIGKRWHEFEEIESQGKAVEVTVNRKEENS